MKKIILPALLAVLTIVSSCRTETVTCDPGFLELYAVGFNHSAPYGGKITWYIANTGTVVDSQGINLGVGRPDTIKLITMQPWYDYKLQLSDTTIYSINSITPSGIKQQSYKRGIMNGKEMGCTERVVSYTLNGVRYDMSGNKYDRVYIR